MKKIILAALVGILFAACGSKQETKTVEEQAQAYAEQMEQAVQAGDTATAKSLAQEIKTWHDGLTAEDQLKVLTVTDIEEVIAKAEKDLNVSLLDVVKDAAQDVADAAEEAATDVADKTKATVEETVQDAKEAGKQAVDKAKEAGKAAINDAADKGAQAIKEGADKAAKSLGL